MKTNKTIVLVQSRSGMDIAGTCAPPHALLCVAAPLDKEGYTVQIIDARVDPKWEDRLIQACLDKPLFVGVTCMVGTQVKYAIEVARTVRRFEGIPIVFGGPLPTLIPEQFIESGLADYVFKREVDETIVGLAHKIAIGQCEQIVDSPFPDMENLLDTPWHLIEVEKYIHPDMYVKNGRRTMDVGQTSRRCPHMCSFCASATIGGRKWRPMSAKKSIRMITKAVEDFDLTGFWLRDDEFYINADRAAEICEGITPLNVKWYTSGTRVDGFLRVPEEQVDLYKKAGAYTLKFGAESGSNRILKQMNKGITREQTIEANLKAKRHGIQPAFALMMGFPTETWEDIHQTIDLARTLRRDNPDAQFETMAIYTAHPGTPGLPLAIEHGLKVPTKLEEWAEWNADEYDPKGERNPWFNDADRKAMANLCYISMLSNAVPNVIDSLENKVIANILRAGYYPFHKYYQWSFFNAHYRNHPELPLVHELRKALFYNNKKVFK